MAGDSVNCGGEAASRRYVLSIDLGSGGPKAAVVSDSGNIVSSAGETVVTHLIAGGGAEQDPDQWWRGAMAAGRRAVRASGVAPEAIVAVCCTSQWSVIVPVDQNGEALMRAVHWLDTRGGRYNRQITRGRINVQGYGLGKLWKWVRLTGIAPTHSGVDSLGHILFIKHERPDVYRKTEVFLEPMDFLTFRLTGRATGTQGSLLPLALVDNRRWSCRDYSDPLLRLAGLDSSKFPKLIPNDGIVGTLLPPVAEQLGLRPGTRVTAGVNDTHASAIGAGAVRDFEGVIYIGTSAVLTCHIPFKKTDLFHMMASMPSPLPDKYLLLAEQGTGGKNLEFYLRQIVYGDDEFSIGPTPGDMYERLNRAAGRVGAGAEGLLFLPWLNGSLAPEENPHARGGFFNLSLSASRRHLARAVLEGIAFNNRWTMGPAERFVGRKFSGFRLAGGGARSDLWAQIHADVLGVPIHRVADAPLTTLRGAALLGLSALGMRRVDELTDLVTIERTFEPAAENRAVYDRSFRQFRAVYRKNKSIFKALNKG